MDGSYDSITNRFSCGVVLFYNGVEKHFTDKNLAEMNNVAGELKGAETALQYCLDLDIKSITIFTITKVSLNGARVSGRRKKRRNKIL